MNLVHRVRTSYFGTETRSTRVGPFEWANYGEGDWSLSLTVVPFRQPGLGLFLSLSHGYHEDEPCECPRCVAKREEADQ